MSLTFRFDSIDFSPNYNDNHNIKSMFINNRRNLTFTSMDFFLHRVTFSSKNNFYIHT